MGRKPPGKRALRPGKDRVRCRTPLELPLYSRRITRFYGILELIWNFLIESEQFLSKVFGN